MKMLILTAALFALGAKAADFRKNEVHHTQWGDHKVLWLEDSRLPVTTVSIYFGDGALRDDPKQAGLTQSAFDLLFAGTKNLSQKELSEYFDFYGVDFDHNVTHEYGVLSFSALTKDLPAVVDKFCQVVKEANFPRGEVVPHKKRAISRLRNLPSNHAALAERAFRAVMMKGSSYEAPVEGTLASLQLLRSEGLQKRWSELRDEAPKRFYIKGPRESLFIRDRFLANCGWKTSHAQSYRLRNPVSGMGHRIFFVPAPGANQAQVRVGRFLGREEAHDPDERLGFASFYLGGGFTSRLIQELRVKRGLTYSVGAYVSLQAAYGRSGITTFTKNETVGELLTLLRSELALASKPEGISSEAMEHVRRFVIGHYPFTFEGSDKFLMQLIALEHVGEPLEKLYLYPERIQALQATQVADAVRKLFTWDEQVIVVVGDPSIKKELEKIRPVETIQAASLL